MEEKNNVYIFSQLKRPRLTPAVQRMRAAEFETLYREQEVYTGDRRLGILASRVAVRLHLDRFLLKPKH